MVFVLFATSLILTSLPLVTILAEGTFHKYFVYFVAGISFLLLNLIGSISPNILTGYPDLGLHLVHLSTSAILFVTFLLLKTMSSGIRVQPLEARLGGRLEQYGSSLRLQTVLLLGLTFTAVILLSLTVTPPPLFQVELFGNWPELIRQRIRVVFSGSFHWYALAFFEAPLFLAILVTLVGEIARRGTSSRDEARWRKIRYALLPFAALSSVLFLNKQYIIYLLAAIALVVMVVRGRIWAGAIIKYASAFLIIIFLLYLVFAGIEPNNISYILHIIAHRTFEVYPLAGAAAFDIFPQEMQFLEGRSILNPHGILPFESVNVAEIIYPRIYGEVGFGSAPLPAVFESYANFGWPGVFVSNLLIALLIVCISLMSWSRRVTVVVLAIYWTLKLTLLWQGPFWFGTLEPNLIIFSMGLLAFMGLVTPRLAGLLPKENPRRATAWTWGQR